MSQVDNMHICSGVECGSSQFSEGNTISDPFLNLPANHSQVETQASSIESETNNLPRGDVHTQEKPVYDDPFKANNSNQVPEIISASTMDAHSHTETRSLSGDGTSNTWEQNIDVHSVNGSEPTVEITSTGSNNNNQAKKIHAPTHSHNINEIPHDSLHTHSGHRNSQNGIEHLEESSSLFRRPDDAHSHHVHFDHTDHAHSVFDQAHSVLERYLPMEAIK